MALLRIRSLAALISSPRKTARRVKTQRGDYKDANQGLPQVKATMYISSESFGTNLHRHKSTECATRFKAPVQRFSILTLFHTVRCKMPVSISGGPAMAWKHAATSKWQLM